MKLRWIVLLFALMLAAIAPAQAFLFSDSNWSGASFKLERDWPGGGRFEANVRSIRVERGEVITLYSEPNYRGRSFVVTEDARNFPFGFTVRSARIGNYPTSTTVNEGSGNSGNNWGLHDFDGAHPVVYMDRDYRGRSWRLTSDWRGGGEWDGRASSIRVPRGWEVTFYSERDFRGNTHTLRGDWSAARDDWWDGRVRSIRIRMTNSRPPTQEIRGDVAIYASRGWNGEEDVLRGDWAGNSKWSGRPHWIYSVRVPSGYRVTFFSQPGYRGERHTVTGNWSAASGDYWEKRIRSIRIERLGSNNGDNNDFRVPVIYAEKEYRGASLTLDRDWRGDSNWDGSPYRVRSIRVPSGWRVVLYDRPDFRGGSYELDRDWTPPSFSPWATNIRSIRVIRN